MARILTWGKAICLGFFAKRSPDFSKALRIPLTYLPLYGLIATLIFKYNFGIAELQVTQVKLLLNFPGQG